MSIRLMGLAILFGICLISRPAMPQEAAPADIGRLDKLIRGLDGVTGNIENEPGFWLFEFQGRPVYVVVNPANNQLQILAPIAPVGTLNSATLVRTLQANFSATNEARYAIAKDLLWSVFASSVANLEEAEFEASLKQVVSTASTFANLIVPDKAAPKTDENSNADGIELIAPEDGKS